MERHQWKNGDVVRLKEDNGKSWQISKTNDIQGEWFLAEIRDCGIAGGWVSTYILDTNYEFVNNPIDDAQEAIKKEFDKIRECVKESSWGEKVDLEKEVREYVQENFTIPSIDKEQLDRFGIEEKDYMYSMDKSDMLSMAKYFFELGLNTQKGE